MTSTTKQTNPRPLNQTRLGRVLFGRFTNRLVASARGRRHILNQAADAEDSDEGQIFEILLDKVDDPELHKLVRIHQADETRHAEMFREALGRNGFSPYPVASELSLLEQLDAALGNFFDTFLEREHPVMEAYLLLQVIEERAVTQFGELQPAFEKFDPQTATVLEQIAKDEERHLKYCVAIAKRYAPDAETAERTLNRFREVEAEVFAKISLANMTKALDDELLDMSPIEMRLWRGLLGLLKRRSQPVRTPFASAARAAA